MATLEQHPDDTEDNDAPEEYNPSTAEAQEQTRDEISEPVTVVEGLKGAFIEVAEDPDGAWHWALWAGNGRIIARSGQTHGTFKACVQALRSIVKLWAEKLPIVRSHKA